jgi:1,4-dihydroxy-2-naphthoyl-CoA hydrolase
VDDRLTEMMCAAMPFAAALEIEGLSAADGVVVARLAWSPERCTAGGLLHGGALMTLADATAATCAYLALPADATGTSTIESKTNFMRAVRSGTVTATAEIVHSGRTTIVVQTDLHDDSGRLVARTLQTQAVVRPT